MIFKKNTSKLSKDRDGYTITINYPTSSSNRPRWGFQSPPHPILNEIIDQNRSNYQGLLYKFLNYQTEYRKINIAENTNNPYEPFLNNPWLTGLDSLSLYCLLALYQPAKYIEIGSGNSTKFARQSINNHELKTKLISIDPKPRAEIDTLCDSVIRKPLELLDLTLFYELEANDILFIDNSHRCFMNSDVTVTFLDIIPRLQPGVLVEIHDIFLPYDYPPNWANRYYNEQYILAAFLLAQGQKFEILMPNAFISRDPSLHGILKPIFDGLQGVRSGGGSFWLIIK